MTPRTPILSSDPPPSLVDRKGTPHFGMWRAPLSLVNIQDATIATPAPFGRFRLKQWQHFCVVHPDVALTFAVVDVGYLSLSWVQVVDRLSDAHFEHRRQSPFLRTGIAQSLWDEHTYADGRGYAIEVHNHLDGEGHHVFIDVKGDNPVRAEFTCIHDLAETEPLVVSLPVGRGRTMYSHKVPLPVVGRVEVGGRTVDLDPSDTVAILDIHKAHYPRRTWWHWATFAGQLGGRRVAVNLTDNVVEEAHFHENAVWIDGRVHLLGNAKMQFEGPWTAGTVDGRVALDFAEQGGRGEDLHYGVIVSRFQQKFGTFSGSVDTGEEQLPIDALWGLFENHEAVW